VRRLRDGAVESRRDAEPVAQIARDLISSHAARARHLVLAHIVALQERVIFEPMVLGTVSSG
jgi:hypothetical protein